MRLIKLSFNTSLFKLFTQPIKVGASYCAECRHAKYLQNDRGLLHKWCINKKAIEDRTQNAYNTGEDLVQTYNMNREFDCPYYKMARYMRIRLWINIIFVLVLGCTWRLGAWLKNLKK